MRTDTLDILTPEGITFSMRLAGPVTRFLAWAIDAVVVWIISFLIVFIAQVSGLALLGLFGSFGLDVGIALATTAIFILRVGYSIALEWAWRGQTIGKRVLRLRVVDEQGLHLQFSQVAVRNLLRFVDSLPLFYLVGGIACLTSKRAQRLGDYVANTVVVRVPKVYEPDLSKTRSDKYNSMRDYPHIVARLRQRVSAEEARIGLQAMLRRDSLDADARVELFQEIAEYYRELADFPEEATFGLTDEQYVRNVIDVLFNTEREAARAEM